MTTKRPDDKFSDEEATRRRDAVIKRMLSTPPKPHSELKIGKSKNKESGDAIQGEQKDLAP
jgi:hypothetical protein